MTLPPRLRLEQLVPLSSEDRQLLADAVVRTLDVGRNHDLIREGESPAECYFVLEGMVRRYKLLQDGGRQIVGFQVPGDLCDINGLIVGRMDHSLATVTRSRLAVIPKAALLRLEKRPQISLALWKETVLDAAIAREWVANLGRRNAFQRVAHLLCEIGRRLEAAGEAEGGQFWWPVSQAEVADAMGLSSVHVNRVYQQLRRDGLLVTEGENILVPDWRKLEAAGHFTPDFLFLDAAGDQEHA